jgi:quercetin dioxygenase-like cupin family protein
MMFVPAHRRNFMVQIQTAQGTGKELSPGLPVQLPALVEYQAGAVVSRTLVKSTAGTITLFAFDAQQGLSEHSAPFDAFVQALDGEATFTIGGKELQVSSGQSLIMPANIPHAIQATAPFKMLLTMIRERASQVATV